MFFDQNEIRLEIDNRKLTEKSQKIWIFNKIFLNNPCFKEESSRKKQKISEHIKICGRQLKQCLAVHLQHSMLTLKKKKGLRLIINFYLKEKSKINSYQAERIKEKRKKSIKLKTTSSREKNVNETTSSFFEKNQ